MANQIAKKELLEETLHHHPEGSEEEVDKEWEEFTRLMAKLKGNRRNRPRRYIHIADCFFLISASGKDIYKFRNKAIKYRLHINKKNILFFTENCSIL